MIQGLSQIFTMTSRLKSLFIESYELMTANPDFQSLIINALLKKDIDLFLVDAMFADFIFPVCNLLHQLLNHKLKLVIKEDFNKRLFFYFFLDH